MKSILLFLALASFGFSQNLKPPVQADSTLNNRVTLPIADSILIEDMNFKNADIRDVLRTIGSQFSVNIWLAPEVEGKIPVSFKKIPVKTALDFIITKYGYQYRVKNGIVEVTRPAPPPLPPEPKPIIQCAIRLDNGGKLEIDVKDAPIDTVIRSIIRETRLNLIVDKSVSGKMSGILRGVDVEKGLSAFFESNGLELSKKNDILYLSKPAWSSSGNAGESKQSGKRLSVWVDSGKVRMEVTDADLAEVINIIGSRSGMSIFVYGKIEGKVTAKLEQGRDVEDVMKYLLNGTNYTFWKDKEIYFIGDKSAKSFSTGELVRLKYMKAEEVMNLLPEAITQYTKVKVVKEQNGLLFMGTYDYIMSAKDFISIVDQPIAQILIEALVVDFSINKVRELGIKLFTGSGSGGTGNSSLYPSLDVTATGKDLSNIAAKKLSDYFTLEQITNLPANFRAQISALEQQGFANVLSTPQIATLNGNNATILIGTTQYFLLKSASVTPGNTPIVNETERFEKIEADVSLTVTPWITGTKEVTVEINPVFHIPGTSVDPKIPPPVNKRELKSVVRLKDGETYVLGGLIEDTERKTMKGLPFLSSIPVLGWLFKTNRTEHVKTRMMIFLTPHIYYGNEGAVDKDGFIKSLQ